MAVDGVIDDIWAIGQDGATLHGDAKGWIAGTTPTHEILTGVMRRARDDVWAVSRAAVTGCGFIVGVQRRPVRGAAAGRGDGR